VGWEDELLPVDLDAPGAAADLAGARRVYEIWPPLGDTPDRSGRRVEAVVALADEPDAEQAAALAHTLDAVMSAGPVDPPATAEALEGPPWCTFKLFGAADRQDHVLLDVIEPAVGAAAAAGEIAAWFFLRYVDGPGRRPHLRLRVQLPASADRARHEAAFARRLDEHLADAMATSDVVAIERAPYVPETSRFGGLAAMPAIHQLFAADSALACALLALLGDPADPLELDPTDAADTRSVLLVCSFDALARAFALDEGQRRELALRRLRAHADGPEDDALRTAEQGRAFRTAGPRLRRLVGAPPPPLSEALTSFRARAAPAAAALPPATRARVLPPLLHLAAVRLAGADRDAELLAYGYWARVLDSLRHHGVAGKTRPRS
jgi:thiopeptide-type bacteriocin biosynthesis protein